MGFDATKARRGQRYFYEKLVYTGWPFAGTGGASSLGTGTTTFFNVQNWNEPGQVATRAEIAMLQMTQQAATGVTLAFTADPGNQIDSLNQGDLISARAGERFMSADIRAVDQIAASLDNSQSAAIAGFTGNIAVASRRLTVLDKLFATQVAGLQSSRGAYALLPIEQQALAKVGLTAASAAQLVGKGTMPFSTEQWLRVLIDAHTVTVHDDFFDLSVTSDDNPFAPYGAKMDPANPARGRFLVLDRIAIEGGDKALITVNRDSDTDSYYQVNGAAFVQSDDAPWDVFLAAFEHMTVHAINDTGATGTNTVGVRLRVREVAMSDILAVLTGRVTDASQVPGQTFWKALVGLMSG